MSKMGRYKSYLTGVQNEGRGRGHFWTISKRKCFFFMASLNKAFVKNKIKKTLKQKNLIKKNMMSKIFGMRQTSCF